MRDPPDDDADDPSSQHSPPLCLGLCFRSRHPCRHENLVTAAAHPGQPYPPGGTATLRRSCAAFPLAFSATRYTGSIGFASSSGPAWHLDRVTILTLRSLRGGQVPSGPRRGRTPANFSQRCPEHLPIDRSSPRRRPSSHPPPTAPGYSFGYCFVLCLSPSAEVPLPKRLYLWSSSSPVSDDSFCQPWFRLGRPLSLC